MMLFTMLPLPRPRVEERMYIKYEANASTRVAFYRAQYSFDCKYEQ